MKVTRIIVVFQHGEPTTEWVLDSVVYAIIAGSVRRPIIFGVPDYATFMYLKEAKQRYGVEIIFYYISNDSREGPSPFQESEEVIELEEYFSELHNEAEQNNNVPDPIDEDLFDF